MRTAAARVAARLPGQVAETVLLFLLQDQHPAVYWRAYQALERRGVNVEERLLQQLTGGPAETRYWAPQVLAKLALPSADTFLLGSLYDADPLVATAAATGLLLLPDPDLPALVVDLLREARPAQRAPIIRGLAACLYEYEPAWFTLAREADDDLHAHVKAGLKRFARAGLPALLAEQVQWGQEAHCRALLAAMPLQPH